MYVDIMGFCSYFGMLLVKNCPPDIAENNPTMFTFTIRTHTHSPHFMLCLIVPPSLNVKYGLSANLSFSIFGYSATCYGMFSV